MASPLRIGYVPGNPPFPLLPSLLTPSPLHNLADTAPEHFSTPLHFAQKHFALAATLYPFPAGTGAMVAALQAHAIDVAIGLTEGWVAALGKAPASVAPPFSLVGTYVETPLCWAISTGAARADIASVADLRGKTAGVSRIGSGSHVMSYVLADERGWLDAPGLSGADGQQRQQQQQQQAPFPVVPLETFAGLRTGVNAGAADFFLWEHFTSKRYHDCGEIRRVGELYTPWSSWKIVAGAHAVPDPPADARLRDALAKIDLGVAYFESHPDEAVRHISSMLDYSDEDARAWLATVRFARPSVRGVRRDVVATTVATLQKAGVLGENVNVGNMIGIARES